MANVLRICEAGPVTGFYPAILFRKGSADLTRRGFADYGAGLIDGLGSGVGPKMLGSRMWLHFGQRGRPPNTAA